MDDTDAMTTDAPLWRCRHCGCVLGLVVRDRLYIGDHATLVQLLPGSGVVCPTCGRTRHWHTRRDDGNSTTARVAQHGDHVATDG